MAVVPYRLERPGPVAWDMLVALSVFAFLAAVVSQGQFAISRMPEPVVSWEAYPLIGLASALLLVRRSRPMLVFLGSTVALAGLGFVPAALGMPVAPGVALYTAAAQADRSRLSVRSVVVVLLGFGLFGLGAGLAVSTMPSSELFHGALLWAFCWTAGERTRLRREQITELEQSAAQAHELAAAQERARMARDLHDSAGHAINVIAVRAGAARMRHRDDPDRSLDALVMIEDVARRTATELDHLVRVLRAPGETSQLSPPSLALVDELAAEHRATGLDVTVRVEGSARPLSAAVDQAAYRIVQEGLTNASRHGTGTAEVRLDYCTDQVGILVTNPVRLDRLHSQEPYGHGLTGARERAQLAGGTLSVTRGPQQFTLEATLPPGIDPT